MTAEARRKLTVKALVWIGAILVVAIPVVLVLIISRSERSGDNSIQMETSTYVTGVTIAGSDVSGMTLQEAYENSVIATKAQTMLQDVSYTVLVNGTEYQMSAKELGVSTDLLHVLEEALIYGNAGNTQASASMQRRIARNNGVDFDISPYAEQDVVLNKLEKLKPDMDIDPADARVELSQGSSGEVEFIYHDEVIGVDVDIAQLAQMICANVNNGSNDIIVAPVIITNPKVDIETLKQNTQRISSYTSSFDEPPLNNKGRVTNVKLFAEVVDNTVLQPGEVWSLNDAAGPRNEETAETVGWAKAPGISRGRYTDQVGGGVCQISSSLYNAAIRAELEIVERKPHSWPSSYIAFGMDATISTGGPDLKISNPFHMPIYMVAYVDEEACTATVEIYGPPLTHGYTIDFTSTLVGTTKPGNAQYFYNSQTDPSGNAIKQGETVTWIRERDGQKWSVYKQYLDANGDVVKTEFYSETQYRSFAAEYYVNGPDPNALSVAP